MQERKSFKKDGREISKLMIYHIQEANHFSEHNFLCQKHVLRLVIAIRMKIGKGDLEERGKSKGRRLKNRIKLYNVPAPTPQDDCKLPLLHPCTNNNNKKKDGLRNRIMLRSLAYFSYWRVNGGFTPK